MLDLHKPADACSEGSGECCLLLRIYTCSGTAGKRIIK